MAASTELQSLLDACPAALVHWVASERYARPNSVARALAAQANEADWLQWLADVQKVQPLLAADQASPEAVATAGTANVSLPTSAQRVLVRANPAPGGGWLLGLTPQTEARGTTFNVAQIQPESQLALAVELGQIALWRHDFASQRFHYNTQAWSVLGLPPSSDGLSLEEVRAFVHPDDLPAVVASAQAALHADKPTDMEARYRRADGSWRQVLTRRVVQRNSAGHAVAFLGVAMDVTEPRDAALALRSAAERIALVTRSAGLGTWERDLRTERDLWDDQMWLLRGHRPQAQTMSAELRLQAIHPDDRELTAQRYKEAMTDHSNLEYEFRVVWPDGQVRWLAARSKTVFDELGHPLRRIGVNWDITDARNAAAMRQETEMAQLESVAKSRFMARVSHELRTPLNAVLGFTQLLLAQETTDDTTPGSQFTVRRQRLGHIQTAGQHLLRLINDVLDLTGLESGELPIALETFDLAAALQGCLPMVEPALRARQIELLNEVPPLQVRANATRLQQVLLNLLSNAVKYNIDQGRVHVLAWANGSWVHLRVSDTGQGMDAEQLRALFEPFNRLGAETSLIEGSGIGLTIAKALTERMGGSLEAQSAPGQGSSFELRLPAANHSTPPMTENVPTASTAPPALAMQCPPEVPAGISGTTVATVPTGPAPQRKVLYVEDNPVNALIISELLALRPHWALHVAPDGESGLLHATTELPDLVLLDMQLPDIDGLEVLRRLRAVPATAQIPCFAVSANAMPEDIERALRAGAADYWTKPLDLASFMAALDRLFDSTGSPETGQGLESELNSRISP